MKSKLFIFLFLFSTSTFAQTLVNIGNTSITKKDVQDFIDEMKDKGFNTNNISEDYALERLIDFKLGLMDAKSKKVDQEKEAQQAIDDALYSYYISKNVDSKYKNKRFSNKEIVDYYKKNPLVKVQRLTYSFDPQLSGDMNKAKTQIMLIRNDINLKKLSFEQALEKTKDKAMEQFTGTFDKVLISELPYLESIELSELKIMELSSIIQLGNFFMISRVVQKYPYSNEYADDINEILKQDAIIKERNQFLLSLRQKYSTIIKDKRDL